MCGVWCLCRHFALEVFASSLYLGLLLLLHLCGVVGGTDFDDSVLEAGALGSGGGLAASAGACFVLGYALIGRDTGIFAALAGALAVAAFLRLAASLAAGALRFLGDAVFEGMESGEVLLRGGGSKTVRVRVGEGGGVWAGFVARRGRDGGLPRGGRRCGRDGVVVVVVGFAVRGGLELRAVLALDGLCNALRMAVLRLDADGRGERRELPVSAHLQWHVVQVILIVPVVLVFFPKSVVLVPFIVTTIFMIVSCCSNSLPWCWCKGGLTWFIWRLVLIIARLSRIKAWEYIIQALKLLVRWIKDRTIGQPIAMVARVRWERIRKLSGVTPSFIFLSELSAIGNKSFAVLPHGRHCRNRVCIPQAHELNGNIFVRDARSDGWCRRRNCSRQCAVLNWHVVRPRIRVIPGIGWRCRMRVAVVSLSVRCGILRRWARRAQRGYGAVANR